MADFRDAYYFLELPWADANFTMQQFLRAGRLVMSSKYSC